MYNPTLKLDNGTRWKRFTSEVDIIRYYVHNEKAYVYVRPDHPIVELTSAKDVLKYIDNGALFVIPAPEPDGVMEVVAKTTIEEIEYKYPYYRGEERENVEIPWEEMSYMDTLPVEISTVIEHLEYLRRYGCTFVTFASHPDHSAYYFYGLKHIIK